MDLSWFRLKDVDVEENGGVQSQFADISAIDYILEYSSRN